MKIIKIIYNKQPAEKKERAMSRTSTLPFDLIMVNFMSMVLGIVLRVEDDAETGWESSSK